MENIKEMIFYPDGSFKVIFVNKATSIKKSEGISLSNAKLIEAKYRKIADKYFQKPIKYSTFLDKHSNANGKSKSESSRILYKMRDLGFIKKNDVGRWVIDNPKDNVEISENITNFLGVSNG